MHARTYFLLRLLQEINNINTVRQLKTFTIHISSIERLCEFSYYIYRISVVFAPILRVGKRSHTRSFAHVQ